MPASVLIERTSIVDDDLRMTAVSDVPVESLAADVPANGTVLDERYEILGLLGQGGMGHVLSARHVVLGHRLAIKVLRREMTRDPEIVERFRREARAASAIGHSGIVAVKDFGALPSGASYYVMEHVDGVSLADALASEARFSIERAVDVVRQIADALGAAHAEGIVHRDVKPENVLLATFHGRPDHVKVLDFGICKLDFASRLSGAHRVLGTPAYMSPEQSRGQGLDHRSDVYALGTLFYELLVGDVPFDDARPLEVLRQQIQVPAPSVKLKRPDVPDVLAALIASCLEKDPNARPASMHDIVTQLTAFAPVRVASFVGSAPAPAPARTSPLPEAVASAIVITPAASVSRPTPFKPMAPVAPRSGRAPLVLAAGVALTLVGVVALAAAGGILLRERADESVAMPAAAAPLPPTVAPPSAAPAPVAVAVPAPPTVGAPTASIPVSPPTHAAHHAAHPIVAATPVEVAPPPAAPAPVEHPAIRVIDPWDQP